MSTATVEHQHPVRQRLARNYSRIFTPALMLAVLVVLSGIKAGLNWLSVIALLVGIAVVPGLIYKRSKGLFRRLGLADHWRNALVTALLFVGTVVCYLIPLPQPVPATVTALLVGNMGLLFFRRWLNVSAHVSVMTLFVTWVAAVVGGFACLGLVLSPLMMVSRVTLGEHTWREALSGAALGLGAFSCYLLAMTWR
ncbi:hypothetical protein [Arthrobacter sp. AD-310]